MYPDSLSSPPERVDLGDVIGAMEGELRCLLGPAIGLTTGTLPAGRTAAVRARREDIVDLLRHLALDARDAMPAGGMLAIRTGQLREVAECAAIVLHELPDAPASDPDSASVRLRKGRSLGLKASYETIERAGGHFHVSCRGRETVLTICFPIAS
jgi:hypothetical protein